MYNEEILNIFIIILKKVKYVLFDNIKSELNEIVLTDSIRIADHLAILTFWSLTFITMYISPSRFTHKTRSTLYVTRAVFTIGRTRDVTFTSVETSVITTCI